MIVSIFSLNLYWFYFYSSNDIIAGYGLEMRFTACPSKVYTVVIHPAVWLHQAYAKYYVCGWIFAAGQCIFLNYLEYRICKSTKKWFSIDQDLF